MHCFVCICFSWCGGGEGADGAADGVASVEKEFGCAGGDVAVYACDEDEAFCVGHFGGWGMGNGMGGVF